jgi:hypothetical protein
MIPGIDPYPIIGHTEPVAFRNLLYRYVHPWRFIPSELDGITYQILQDLDKLRQTSADYREGIVGDLSLILLNHDPKVGQDLLQNLLHGDGLKRLSNLAGAAKHEHSGNQLLHSFHALMNEPQVFGRGLIQLAPAMIL